MAFRLNESEAILQAEKGFRNWRFDPSEDMDKFFICHKHAAKIRVNLRICKARAAKPELFNENCHGCPRWKHFRNELKKELKKRPKPAPKSKPFKG